MRLNDKQYKQWLAERSIQQVLGVLVLFFVYMQSHILFLDFLLLIMSCSQDVHIFYYNIFKMLDLLAIYHGLVLGKFL